MARTRRLPPYVQAVRRKSRVRYRGWYMVAGARQYTHLVDDPGEAYRLAMVGRGEAEKVSAGNLPTLGEAMHAVLEDARARLTKGTEKWYSDHFASLLRAWPEGTLLHDLTPGAIEQWILERRRSVSASTVNADLRALHRCFSVAIRRGYVGDNPVRRVDRPKESDREMDYFEAEELTAILSIVRDACGFQEHDMIAFFASTGVRRSEAARLEVDHVNLASRLVWIAGKRGGRRVPLSATRLVTDAGSGASPVFPGGVAYIDRSFRSAKKAANDRRVHPHAMRHTFGTMMARAGVDPYTVRDLMGHRDLRTTMRYYHGHIEAQRAAVGTLRLVPPPPGIERSGDA